MLGTKPEFCFERKVGEAVMTLNRAVKIYRIQGFTKPSSCGFNDPPLSPIFLKP